VLLIPESASVSQSRTWPGTAVRTWTMKTSQLVNGLKDCLHYGNIHILAQTGKYVARNNQYDEINHQDMDIFYHHNQDQGLQHGQTRNIVGHGLGDFEERIIIIAGCNL